MQPLQNLFLFFVLFSVNTTYYAQSSSDISLNAENSIIQQADTSSSDTSSSGFVRKPINFRFTAIGAAAIPAGSFAIEGFTKAKPGFLVSGEGILYTSFPVDFGFFLSYSDNSLDLSSRYKYNGFSAFWALLGGRVKGIVSDEFEIYGSGAAGYSVVSGPSVTLIDGLGPGEPWVVMDCGRAYAFGYMAGGGFVIQDRFDIGLRYLGSRPDFKGLKVPVRIISLMFGYRF